MSRSDPLPALRKEPLLWLALRYGLAVMAVAAAFGLHQMLRAWSGAALPPFILFYPAIIVVALVAGLGPGLAATALTLIVVSFWIMPPAGQFSIASAADRLALSIFAFNGVLICAIAELYRRNRRKVADYEREAALRESREALRRHAELIDPVRADIIAQEMQRVVRERGVAVASPVEPTGETLVRVSIVVGAVVAGMGLLVLAGWLFDLDAFKSVLPGMATMKPNTALCFLLAGVALVLGSAGIVARHSNVESGTSQRRLDIGILSYWAGMAAAVVMLVSGLTMVQYITGADFGIDQLLFRDTRDAHTIFPGRMAEATALGFLFTGASLLLLGARSRGGRHAQQMLAVCAGVIGMVAVLGYLYDVRQLYRFYGFSSMALHTAGSLMALAIGLIFARRDGLAGMLATPDLGAQLGRRLLPVALLLPAALGWLIEFGLHRGLYGEGMDKALLALVTTLSLAALVSGAARALSRSDAARRENETQLRNQAEVMDHAHDALIMRELDGVIRSWNRGAEKLYGWSPVEALGQRINDLLHAPASSVQEIRTALEQTGRWEGELLHLTCDGRRITVESRKTATRTADGRLLVLESNRDITARKQVEQELHYSDRRLREANAELQRRIAQEQTEAVNQHQARRAAVNLAREAVAARAQAEQAVAELRVSERAMREAQAVAHVGSWEWNASTDRVVVSEELRRIYGLPDGERVPDFREQDGRWYSHESWVRLNAAVQESFRTGIGYDLEIEALRNGERIWVNTRSDVVRDEVGNIVGLRGTGQDITKRKHADERLRESEERFRLMADNIAQMAWMADGAGSLFWYNQRWFDYTGTTLDEMQGWGWQKVQHPDHLDRVVQKYRHCLETGEPWEDTFPLKGADGNYRWFLSRAIPQRNAFTGQVLRWFGTNTDITEQRAIEEELRKFKVFSHQAGDMHLLLDRTGRIRYANKLACTQLGYSESELLSLNIAAINPPRAGHSFQEIFARSKESVITPFEGIHRDRSGATIPVEITATIVELDDGWQMFMTSRDITERKGAEEKVRAASMHDLLTGLPNRALVFEYCNHLLAAAQRRHSEGALLFIDLDRFKPVNDLYGHEIGDRVLQEVAKRLVGCTRDEDIVGRLGGDEFVIALPYVTDDHPRAVIVAQHVIEHLSEPFRIDTLEISLSPSIGISYFPKHASEVGSLIRAADLAMYQAKQSGRANYHVYTAELDRRAHQAHSLERQLKHALKNESLQLYYQPVIDLGSGQVISAEALLRLPERNGRRVGPDLFIPIAESAGLIGDLGEWVAVEACRQHEAWQHEGMRIIIAINVSPLQFRQRAFAANLRSIISNSRIDPACLEIEVTESTVMESVDEAVDILNQIKSLGVKVSLDDFGTGYSSLGRLSTLPIDKLKVDQSFVKRIEHDPASRAVTGMIIALGQSMRLDVVGEGIESEEALNYLQAVGCHQGQGYWFGPPLAADDFAQWYRVRRAEVDARLH